MIRNTLEIFGDHEQVNGVFPVRLGQAEHLDKPFFYPVEAAVNHVVVFYDRAGERRVSADEGVHAVCDHFYRAHGHVVYVQRIVALRDVRERHYLRDIGGLVAYALHVRDHFQRRGYKAQVGGDGLLAQQKTYAQLHRLPLGLLYGLRQLRYSGGERHISVKQRFYGERDRVFAVAAHIRYLCFQLRELLPVYIPHQPNLPLI